MQKALAMLFPMWARTNLNATTSLIASMVAFVCSLSLFLPTTITSSLGMFKGSNGTCCYSNKSSSLVLNVFQNGTMDNYSEEFCGICYARHKTKSPNFWCSDCDEGLCTECHEHHNISKSSRNHNVIPIES
ncbi:Hypothetical predicted protein [Mytilus galloprovincialis]|uniref:B box-type domain-containing protein n=1 Tax=Mytilus galloprovincialis TaxID=29158 RepID=A0A8B6F7A1_MYTGA|nr:Hypothetical predicted protein [Mytilus galloprovincialis]